MKATNLFCLVVASNIASFVVTTMAVMYAWNMGRSGSDDASLSQNHSFSHSSSDEASQVVLLTGRRQTQDMCSDSCPCTAPPTPAPVQVVVASQSFTCPTDEGFINFGSSGAIEFSISASNRLCTLVLVSADQASFKPVARSYHANDWEAVAGDFATLSFSCSSGSSCITTLPAPASGTMYQLKSFIAPQLFREQVDEIARFLEQATFGPTRSSIATFEQQSNLPRAFANYILDQQTTVPLTSHRATFRRHLNARQETASLQNAVTHPCQKGTRYRRFAFSIKDRSKFLDITTVGGGNYKALSVDGFVRTVVNGPITNQWDSSLVFEDGSYQMVPTYTGNTKLGETINIFHPAVGGSVAANFGGVLGNPPVDFEPGVADPNILLNLSNANAAPADTGFFQSDAFPVQELILTSDLNDAVCSTIYEPGNPINPVFATFGGNYFIHDARYELLDNTMENPPMDGGGRTVRQTVNIVNPENSVICSNVQRTFVNEDHCKLSFDPQACEALNDDNIPDEEERPDFYLDLTHETMRAIYEATQDRREGPMYLYAVDGIGDRVTEDKSLVPPCDRTTSRWIQVTCTGAANNLDPTMNEIFSTLLSSAGDDNPYVTDVWNWYDVECPAPLFELAGFEIVLPDGSCYRNVHPNHLQIYDFTFWTLPDTHPGNSPTRNPIKEFAEAGSTTLIFPHWHEMDRWSDNRGFFANAGRLGDRIHYFDLPMAIRTQDLNDLFGFTPQAIQYEDSQGVLVCGSPFEVANDLTLQGSQGRGAFDSISSFTTDSGDFIKQKRIIWTHIALTADDQLRQRVAWALSQILVISPTAIQDALIETESVTNYYDIFVRHAFGNYRDILKEVSYSPLMAIMLTYYGSQSTDFVFGVYGNLEFADENYAREIMQLFSTGLFKLNTDGTQVIGENGNPERVYTNLDIVEYARVWTGFQARRRRGNIEGNPYTNYVDPMQIRLEFRDVFPKMGLNQNYIGDGVPLCADLPGKHFLMKGVTYRLLGVNPTPVVVSDPMEWASDPAAIRLKLQPGSSLFAKLCGSQNAASCTNEAKIVLDETVGCSGGECDVDTVRVVEVGNGIFYEYVQPACVHQAFFDNPTMVVQRSSWWDLTCADPRTQVASSACCNTNTGEWVDMYWGERTTFETAQQRCAGTQYPTLCNQYPRPACDDPNIGSYCFGNDQFWTDSACTLRVKVDGDGNVAIIHAPPVEEPEATSRFVRSDSAKTFFRVDWDGDPAGIINNCAPVNTCNPTADGMCVCDVTVTNEQVFFDGALPTRDDVLSTLKIGAFDPTVSGASFTASTNGGVTRYTANGALTAESIFSVFDDNGIRQFRKNEKSTVHVTGRSISFRNPVHFFSLSDIELRDAEHETDAALDHYFYHPNTAPFLAIRFAQRFGVSNPSPGYVSRIAKAFISGSYTFNDGESPVTYGSGDYGDLGALVACVLLDREARSPVLDADPSHGAMKEPLLKIVGLMKALEFNLNVNAGFADFDIEFDRKIGQMAHSIPNVFSFFLPEYTPAGPVSLASLVAPEGQVLTGPRLIETLNGLLSLVKYGLSPCYSGLAGDSWWINYQCGAYSAATDNPETQGKLTYSPTPGSTASDITDELATLLTGGRLSAASRALVDGVIAAEADPDLAVVKAQQLITVTPEFHTTNSVRRNGETRPEPTVPPPSNRPYKAVVYVLLDGGVDSYNMLAPHTCSATNVNGLTLLEQYYAERTSIAITEGERSRVIDATGQPCSQFVIHQDLEIVERLYNTGDLAFFANAGVINKPVNKRNYYEETRSQLFAHNSMKEEAQRIDPFDGAPGTGVLGRMVEILNQKGFNAQPITVSDASVATVGPPGAAVDPLFVSPYDAESFNPMPAGENFDTRPYLDELNDAVDMHSSLFGETYSQRLKKALFDNEILVQSLATTQLTEQFGGSEYSEQLAPVATLIKSRSLRGTDRDVFFVNFAGWDHHQAVKRDLARNFQAMNGALTSFYNEMVAQGMWDNVSLVITSDFGRTLTANSGEGSDHAWGGNYFVMGGAVKGGQIHGEYPPDITPSGPLNLGRGRLIPTMSWESILQSVVEWMGVETQAEFDQCLPNRIQTGTKLFSASEVFE